MCGIAGIVDHNGRMSSNIDSMTHALAHRGPDAQDVFTDNSHGVALGHTRLSIIDLSTAANQPFHSSDGRYVTVFNGEIYNFRSLRKILTEQHRVEFRTTSDTEVLVEGFAAWGTSLATRLEGMFAFAILDRHTGSLFLFRDRVGKKPLYYAESDDHFVFASEIKSLLQHPGVRRGAKIRIESFPTFLHLGYIPGPYTIYTNIVKFPAGHYGELHAGGKLKINPYWKLEDQLSPNRIVDVALAKKQATELLHRAVADRLVSDVPVGAFLSGGTDSSLVSAIASTLTTTPLKTFSIGFKDNKFDESVYARKVGEALRTEHHEFILEERDAISILNNYLDHFDEPFADTSAIPTMLVSRLARQQVKVALTGDGGDELFQGYGAYRWAGRLDSALVRMLRTPARMLLNSTGKSRTQRIGHMFEKTRAGMLRSHIFSQEQYFFSDSELRMLLTPNFPVRDPFIYQDPRQAAKFLTPGEQQAIFDFEYYLRDDLLVKVDRASMYYALECRSPLLDHQLIEFAFKLAPSLKVRKGVSKWLLKELLKTYLPESLIYRQKWGFSVPLSRWLKGDLRYILEETLSDQALADTGLFNVGYVKRLKHDFLNGKDYLYNRLWAVAILQKWLKAHPINING